MSDQSPIRPGYNRDVPMGVVENQPPETIVQSIELSRTAAVFASIGVVTGLAVVLPVVIALWKWAL